MARFSEINSINPNLKQSRITKELGCSSSTLQRYVQYKNMLSLYRIPPNINKRFQIVKLTSKDFKKLQKTMIKPFLKKMKTKKNLKRGDPNEDSIYKRDLIEQGFSTN